ncbi:hypothetical protein GASC598I20_001860, partial [Gilliamella apicola SCGC AB-598-I20]
SLLNLFLFFHFTFIITFITIPSAGTDFIKNKIVVFNIGYGNQLQRFFTGFIESEQIADKNTKKLFVRELIGVYQQKN